MTHRLATLLGLIIVVSIPPPATADTRTFDLLRNFTPGAYLRFVEHDTSYPTGVHIDGTDSWGGQEGKIYLQVDSVLADSASHQRRFYLTIHVIGTFNRRDKDGARTGLVNYQRRDSIVEWLDSASIYGRHKISGWIFYDLPGTTGGEDSLRRADGYYLGRSFYRFMDVDSLSPMLHADTLLIKADNVEVDLSDLLSYGIGASTGLLTYEDLWGGFDAVAGYRRIWLDSSSDQPFDTTGVAGPEPTRPTSSQLLALYPVPTEGALTVRVSATGRRLITLSIVDLLGNVRRSATARAAAGEPTDVAIDCSGLPDGMYFCQFGAGTSAAARPVLVLGSRR